MSHVLYVVLHGPCEVGWLLWLIAPAMVAVCLLWAYGFKERMRTISEYGDPELVSRFSQAPRLAAELFVLAALLTGTAAAIDAAAGPYEQLAPVSVPARSLRVVAVFDASRSSGAEDYRQSWQLYSGVPCPPTPGPCGSRIGTAKEILVHQIMPAIDGNELGLVTYAEDGSGKSDLNPKFGALYTMLVDWNWIRPGSAKGYASDITTGLNKALELFDRDGQNPTMKDVIILFTDGGFDGDLAKLDALLKSLPEKHVKLIVVGMGNVAASPIPLYNSVGGPLGYVQRGKAGVMTARDDKFLDHIQEQSEAQVFRLNPGETVDIAWPSTLAGARVELRTHNLFQYPLGLAMILLAVLFLRKGTLVLCRRLLALGRRLVEPPPGYLE